LGVPAGFSAATGTVVPLGSEPPLNCAVDNSHDVRRHIAGLHRRHRHELIGHTATVGWLVRNKHVERNGQSFPQARILLI